MDARKPRMHLKRKKERTKTLRRDQLRIMVILEETRFDWTLLVLFGSRSACCYVLRVRLPSTSPELTFLVRILHGVSMYLRGLGASVNVVSR